MAKRALSLGEEIAAADQIDELQRALRRAQANELRAKTKAAEVAEAVFQAAYQAALAAGRGQAVKRPKADTRKKKAEVALIHATDWQLGKKTVSYGMATCSARIEQFVEKIVEITDIQRRDHPVDEAVVMFGGDMVEGGGNIYGAQVWEIEAALYEQLFECTRIMETMLRTLAQHFPKVRVVSEFGNHGRLGRYGDATAYGDNADRMAYRITKDRVGDIIDGWQESADWYQIVKIGAYKALLVHGDEIKSYGGNVPAFGILRKANAWASGVIELFDDVFMGHYHQTMTLQLANGGLCRVTGSPESTNEYAREFVAATGKPSQRLCFVDPNRGRITAEYVVWLD